MPETQLIKPAPIRKTVRVRASREQAFRVFAARMGTWWNREHSVLQVMGKTAQADVVIEPKVGGRWYEIGADGSEYDWGRVLAWNPPGRLALAWQLTAEWQYDPDFETTVEVTFAADGEFTEVTFEHSALERYGEAAMQQREGMDGGWAMLMKGYADAVAEGVGP
jgi:uncharacterized protein YndB with AHSA1/START domain